jgi:hypothetical protein
VHTAAEMIERLRAGGVRDEAVLIAMAAVPREEYVLPADREEAYADRALPIGAGQTISQPLMVAIIIEALQLRAGEIALDIGTGSGYQAAVMAACGARVISVERIPELANQAAQRLERLGVDVEVVAADGSVGRSAPAGGAGPPAARGWPSGAAHPQRTRGRGADPGPDERRQMDVGESRAVPLRAPDRSRRLSGGRLTL